MELGESLREAQRKALSWQSKVPMARLDVVQERSRSSTGTKNLNRIDLADNNDDPCGTTESEQSLVLRNLYEGLRCK